MKVAIVGAGLSGLALCYHLLEKGVQVDLFDPQGIGEGICSGLLHPYPGEQMRRSWRADEGLKATGFLLEKADSIPQLGILRFADSFPPHPDLKYVEKGVMMIMSGITVDIPDYLKKLWKVCEKKGATLYKKKVENTETLVGYDKIVLAAGAGIVKFKESEQLKITLVKGQLLLCTLPRGMKPMTISVIAKGYVALGANSRRCIVGSTYEKEFSSLEPDLEKTRKELVEKLSPVFPFVAELTVNECRAGARVVRIGHYYPMVKKVSNTVWVCTAMGSRGLLYHAHAAELLSEALVTDDENKIPMEMRT